MTVIALRNVGKSYSHYRHGMDRLWEMITGRSRHTMFTALQPVSLEITQGEVVGLVGMNGAGKSTLLKILAKTLTPSSGELEVHGRVSALLELGAGFHPDMSGRDNVYLSGSLMGLSTARIDAIYEDIVEFSGLADFMLQPVKTYSSGMFVRLAFAVATSVEPDILIIDEALSVGDGAFARKSFDRIMGFKKAGKTILFCSHSMYQIEAICSRVLWLDHGRVVLDGDPAQVTGAYNEFLGGAPSPAETHSPSPSKEGQTFLPMKPHAGSARLKFVKVMAGEHEGNELEIQSGRMAVRLEIGFESDPALDAPSVAVAFMGRDGRFIASAGTLNDGLVLPRHVDGSGEVSVSFPSFPLLKGNYWVSVYLLCEDGVHVYDQAEAVAELKVSQEGLEQGVVSLPREWCADMPKHAAVAYALQGAHSSLQGRVA